MDDNSFERTGGWGERIRRNASSVLLPIIALLVLAGGVYFYTRGRERSGQPIVEFESTATPTVSPSPTPVAQVTLTPQGTPNTAPPPPVQIEGEQFKVRAGRGEGITHMARRATQEYLSRNSIGFTVTKEHKVYVEDYLKRKILEQRSGRRGIEVNEEITFPNELVKEAIASAQNLSDAQLKRLAVYSARVTQL